MYTTAAFLCLAACLGAPVVAQDYGNLRPVVSGLAEPVGLYAVPGDDTRLFVIEKVGRVRVISVSMATGSPVYTLIAQPFLDIASSITFGHNERGLLGLAFAPDYATSGAFYLNFTGQNGATKVCRFQRHATNHDIAEPASRQDLLTVTQPYANHNGGNIVFGPDGYLYIGMGDGGDGNDPQDRACNPSVLLGKMLRIDVSRDDFPDDPARNYGIPADNPFALAGGAPEVWARGLRNPWRWSFDSWNGDLWIGDVGQDRWEEVDRVPGNGGPGLNYGWRVKEGNRDTGLTTAYDASSLTPPLYVYPRTTGQQGTNGNYPTGTSGRAVVGGVVYRGNAIRPWRGKYIFADTISNTVWAFNADVPTGDGTPAAVGLENWTSRLLTTVDGVTPSSIGNIASFGVDNDGEVYVVELVGRIRKLVPQGVQPPTADVGIQGGLPGADGAFDNNDFVVFIDWFFSDDPRADLGKQGGLRGVDQHLDNNDFIAFIDAFFEGD